MGRNVTISISDRDSGAVFHLSLSLERGRLTWLFVNTRSFYPGQPGSSTPIQNSANDTLRRSQCDGGPRGFQHQYEYSLAPSGSSLEALWQKLQLETPQTHQSEMRHCHFLPDYIYLCYCLHLKDRKNNNIPLWLVIFGLVPRFIREKYSILTTG